MSHKEACVSHRPYRLAADTLRKNNGQWRAYESTGNCVVLAGPGSGKTKTLTIKMARMLAEDVRPPRGIACITYSNQCARELRRRLSALGVDIGKRITIGTLHSFCLKHIILPYAKIAGLSMPDPLNVATGDEREQYWNAAVKSIIGVDENPRDWIFRCELYRKTHLDREKPEWLEDYEDAAKVIEKYEELLLSYCLIDYEMMTYYGLRLIEGYPWVQKAIRARFPILVVDEYQDLGHALHRIVHCLCFKANIRLFAVGDPDQAIYGFNGAEPTLLQNLSEQDSIESIHLRLNYRCGPTIIRASEIALGETRGYKSADDTIGTLDIHHRPKGIGDQASYICNILVPAALERREGRQLGDIAVLYRNQYEGNEIASAVETRGFNFIRIDSGNPYPRTPVVLWLEDCAAWCGGGWRTGEPRLSSLVKVWRSFNETITGDVGRRELQRDLVRFLYSHRDPEQPLWMWLSDFCSFCLDSCLAREPRLREDAIAVQKLSEVCAQKARLAGFTVSAFGGQGGSGTHLNLMTLHSAKGMEFDVVIMMALEEGKMPDYRSKTDKQVREERRLFYVGLTRARHEVHFVYSGWYTTPYNTVKNNGVSRFVEEVRDALAVGP